ncbi:hypothetical protein BJ742DRAFT_565519 [Cladochytrium replicatum]|nr:hypothetical protein BJ742DRAFT_565519 [Cladochytrium replicatum]
MADRVCKPGLLLCRAFVFSLIKVLICVFFHFSFVISQHVKPTEHNICCVQLTLQQSDGEFQRPTPVLAMYLDLKQTRLPPTPQSQVKHKCYWRRLSVEMFNLCDNIKALEVYVLLLVVVNCRVVDQASSAGLGSSSSSSSKEYLNIRHRIDPGR